MKKDKNKEENLKKKKLTTTKKVLYLVLIMSAIDLQLTYILAFIGREEIAESLAITIVTEVIAVFLGYCCKSFFETREEEKNKLIEKHINLNSDEGVSEDSTEESNESGLDPDDEEEAKG